MASSALASPGASIRRKLKYPGIRSGSLPPEACAVRVAGRNAAMAAAALASSTSGTARTNRGRVNRDEVVVWDTKGSSCDERSLPGRLRSASHPVECRHLRTLASTRVSATAPLDEPAHANTVTDAVRMGQLVSPHALLQQSGNLQELQACSLANSFAACLLAAACRCVASAPACHMRDEAAANGAESQRHVARRPSMCGLGKLPCGAPAAGCRGGGGG